MNGEESLTSARERHEAAGGRATATSHGKLSAGDISLSAADRTCAVQGDVLDT